MVQSPHGDVEVSVNTLVPLFWNSQSEPTHKIGCHLEITHECSQGSRNLGLDSFHIWIDILGLPSELVWIGKLIILILLNEVGCWDWTIIWSKPTHSVVSDGIGKFNGGLNEGMGDGGEEWILVSLCWDMVNNLLHMKGMRQEDKKSETWNGEIWVRILDGCMT